MSNFNKAVELLYQMQDKELEEKHAKEKMALRVKQFNMTQTISELISKYPELEKEFLKCFKNPA